MTETSTMLLNCFSRARAVLAVVPGLLVALTPPQLGAQTDNFNDANDTSPVSWYHYTLPSVFAAQYTFPADPTNGKAYKISAPPTIAPYGNARAGSFATTPLYTNRFMIGTDLLSWSTAAHPQMGLCWYFHDLGLGQTDGYIATFSPLDRNIYISMVTNEALAYYFGCLSDGDVTLNATNRVRLEGSSHDGSTFVFTIYNLLEPTTPWASVIGLDYQWAGFGGYGGYMVVNQEYPSASGASATFDNYAATEPAAGTMPAILTDVYPPPAGSSKGDSVYITNSVCIFNRDTTVDPSSIQLCLDGTWIPNSGLTLDYQVLKRNPTAFQQSFSGATASYPIPGILPLGSKHTNIVVFSDSLGTWRTNTWTWTVYYPYLRASNSLPLGSLSVRGFDFHMAQSYNGGTNLDNTLARARQQLAFPPTIPITRSATGLVQVLDWNKSSAVPNNVPGLCSSSVNNIAVESCAYLELSAGVHRFIITSDDRAAVYSGPNLSEANATTLWEAAGSTAHNVIFEFYVEAAGLYPVRCLWEETGGTAELHIKSVDLTDGTQLLINDPTDPTGVVKAWYPLVCKSASSIAGPFAFAATAVNTPAVVDLVGADCSPTVVGQMVTGGTFTVPIAGTTQFYRLDGPRTTRITNISKGATNVVITYQL